MTMNCMEAEVLTPERLVVAARTGKKPISEPFEFIHERLERQARQTPRRPAVVCGGRSLSFEELNARANRLAVKLRDLQIRPNTPVGICLERSLELVIAIYGVLKAGGMYVPLDPAYPAQRLAYMVESVNAGVVIADTENNPALGSRVSHVIPASELARESGTTENPPLVNSPEDLVYTIFTSGSTGRPKGAAVYHSGFSNLLRWFREEFAISGRDKSLLVSSFSFDLTQKNFFAAIGEGGSLHLLPPGRYDPDVVTEAIERDGITLLNCTPSAAYPLVEVEGGTRWERLSSIRYLFLGGEPIATQRLRSWAESGACRAEIVNTYGPTECSDICAFHRLSSEEVRGAAAVPLGEPIYNTTLAVVHEPGGSENRGATGELWIAGAGVGAGYITDPALTREKFVANPEPDLLPGKLVYRSGDLARWRADGLLEFAGRADHQIKIRGFRVELGEIENALDQHAAVKQAVVIARRTADSDLLSLAAYFVPSDEIGLRSEDLRLFLRDRLPEHMVPAEFIEVDSFPLSPNGKVDRKLLSDRATPPPPPPVPQGPRLEEQIAAVWKSVLRVEEVGHDKNFFDLGGDSLQVIEVHLRLKAVIPGERLSVTALFQYPTIGSLCAFLQEPDARPNMAKAIEERANRQKAAFAKRPAADYRAQSFSRPEEQG